MAQPVIRVPPIESKKAQNGGISVAHTCTNYYRKCLPRYAGLCVAAISIWKPYHYVQPYQYLSKKKKKKHINYHSVIKAKMISVTLGHIAFRIPN